MIVRKKDLMFYIVLVGLVLSQIISGFSGSWEPIWSSYTYIQQTPTWVVWASYLSKIMLMYLSITLFFKYRNSIGSGLKLAMYITLLAFICWTIISFREQEFKQIFFGSVSTTLILIPMMVFLGFDDGIWRICQKCVPVLTWLFIAAFFVSTVSFVNQYGMIGTMNSPMKMFFAAAISCAWTFLFGDDKGKKSSYVISILLIIAAFITRSRSWLIHALLILFLVILTSKRKIKGARIIVGALGVALALLVVSSFFPELTSALFDRGTEDSRSGQYLIFFSSYSFSDLIWGEGINAGYSYLGVDNYLYFDNQWLFMLFHYGIPSIIGFIALAYSLYSRLPVTKKECSDIRAARIDYTLLIISYFGLSVYYNIIWGLYPLFIMINIGRALKIKYDRTYECMGE